MAEKAKTPLELSKEALSQMATPQFRKDMSGLIRSRCPLIYLVSVEEKRVLEYFRHYSQIGGFQTRVWDCYLGMVDIVSMQPAGLVIAELKEDPAAALDYIVKEAVEEIEVTSSDDDGKTKKRGNIYLLLDFHRFLSPDCKARIERRLRTLARMDSNSVVVMVGPRYETTPALDNDVRVIDFPLPSDNEIKVALQSAIEGVEGKGTALEASAKAKEKEIIKAVNGLSYVEICSAFAKSIVMHKDVDIPTLLKEKQEVIRKTGTLEFWNTDIGMDDIGGLGNLTTWLKDRSALFDQEARDYGLPIPKGVMLIGVPGSGKSLAAKATAHAYGIPLLRLDFGALFQPHIGESEGLARQALRIAERCAPAVLWVDEIDKGLSGHQSSGKSDSGVTNRVISTFLTWLQEKTVPVFFVCTANQHENIPSEFMRAGRFDEIFFVDLPTRMERQQIISKLIRRKKREAKDFDCRSIADHSEGYTGAELEKALEVALLRGFREQKRPITTDDITQALQTFLPLSKTRASQIEAMRVWATERCVKANSPETSPNVPSMATPRKMNMNEIGEV